ncbi:MAG: inverse autotransporter beta domain-containing protein [Rhizobiales bacterium]|nr:inverse autotransporter beta domain-containing protein [Hyphomicrobiales bacterium]MBO6699679.1 inverse autotransporter beta domain-containing protein [Hyphomicrobiales bacterium]MBO6737217.1 inverse autotransporter beta domain-containing protein [Hyphomicrobiales bacterium]MBO6911709.1 inverse autotransporter beta domain-containing protein [Hyphomicrobiales bacterium]MBO6954869.1 inverse autotransporter beta domain-containing protein [Hyphomicrobiales bacterium]
MFRKISLVVCIFFAALTWPALHAYSNDELSDWDPAAWLARTSGEINFDNGEFSGTLNTIQPLFLSADGRHTGFVQGRINYDNGRQDWTANGGIGYRFLFPGDQWMLGANAWLDHTFEHDHWRLGIGGELFGPHLTARANYYQGLTGWQTVSATTTTRVEQKVVDGFDGSLEAPLPHLPWARLSLGGYYWDFESIDEEAGVRAQLQMNLTPSLTVRGGMDLSDDDERYFVQARLFLGQPAHVAFNALDDGISDVAFVPRPVISQRLAPVERTQTVVVEQRTISTTGISGGVRIGGSI